jgi:GNAT superfamily N-acetyltransferase
MSFQNVSTELDELPGRKYTAVGGGALYVLESTTPTTAASAHAGPASGEVAPAAASGGLVGCIALKDLGSGIAEAKRLFVRPAWRGMDLGRLLLVHIIDVAAQAGYERIRLDTLARFTQANALYALLGFKSIPPYNFNPQDDVLYFELNELPTREYIKGREEQYAPVPRPRTNQRK